MRTFLGLLAVALLQAQAPAAFEVASIRPSTPGKQAIANSTGYLRVSGTNVTGSAMSVHDLIYYGYSLRPFQLSPTESWRTADRWNILAKAPGDLEPSKDQVRAMIRQLLADRFQLQLEREMKEMSVYQLIVGKGGSKLRLTDDPTILGPRRVPRSDGVQEYAEGKQTMEQLVSFLTMGTDRRIVNMTGLADTVTVAFAIRFVPDNFLTAPNAPAGPSLFKAVEDQLGLKLEEVKMPVEHFTIEPVEKPSEN